MDRPRHRGRSGISNLIESTDPDVVIRGSNIINIVAFSLAHNEFALRTGLGSILSIVEPQYCDPEPESMHRGVLGWLRANCRGIMIPTSDRIEVGRILRQMARLRSAEDDEDQADEIEALPSAAMPGSIIRRRMG